MLTTQEKAHFLRCIPSFDALTAEQIEILAHLSEAVAFPSGRRIFRQGDVGHSVYWVFDGQVALERTVNAQTDPILLSIITPIQHFGELSLFTQIAQPFTATAMTDTVVIQILQDILVAFVRQCPDLLVAVNRTLSQQLIRSYEQMSEFVQSRELNILLDF